MGSETKILQKYDTTILQRYVTEGLLWIDKNVNPKKLI